MKSMEWMVPVDLATSAFSGRTSVSRYGPFLQVRFFQKRDQSLGQPAPEFRAIAEDRVQPAFDLAGVEAGAEIRETGDGDLIS